MSQNLKLHYDINGSDFTIAGQASSNIKKVLKQLGVAPDIIRKAAISMYEGEINTVIHGKGGAADVEITTDKLIITFTDHGPGIRDIDQAMQEGFSTATDEARELGFGAGMGLPNMKKYSDELNIASRLGEGTTVEIVIYIA
ncbi:ATP-binding protein [Congzhengia minquanensis]|jgi:serine/threonine-protein kinase RsbT|uniref:ATP-binding protein n=1 Tax=Congzhengia minquanensis TaxID=2763657 RepID=A0A926DPY6_9FIRM|nr:ATP-binding protein [Congzhengia minquanensis]MBC8541689.1 ATP-binding protein [Congzhengia minquanensis]